MLEAARIAWSLYRYALTRSVSPRCLLLPTTHAFARCLLPTILTTVITKYSLHTIPIAPTAYDLTIHTVNVPTSEY